MKLLARLKYDYRDLDRGEAHTHWTCSLERSSKIGRYGA